MTVGSLFSGIGGLDLGFERAGFEVRWMCEKDEYCRSVLTKHWPVVPIYDDVTALDRPPAVDCLIGGFPCPDISKANGIHGQQLGLNGERSGLWHEQARILRTLRPRYAVVENVPNIRKRGLGRVLSDLAEIGYNVQWASLRASDFGACHQRERLFAVAYPIEAGMEGPLTGRSLSPPRPARRGGEAPVRCWPEPGSAEPKDSRWIRSALRRTDDGLPYFVERIGAIGNAVCPDVAEYVARCIMDHARLTG